MSLAVSNTIWIIALLFAALLLFDVISVQINTQFVGRNARISRDLVQPPENCEDPSPFSDVDDTIITNENGSVILNSIVSEPEDISENDSYIQSFFSWVNPFGRFSQSEYEVGNLDVLDDGTPIGDEAPAVTGSKQRVKKMQLRAAVGWAGRKKLKRNIGLNSNAPQDYSFLMNEPNSLVAEDMEYCPGLRHLDLAPVDEKFKFLVVLGAQKAGTSWLHTALKQHPVFVESNHAFRGGWNKEVRFFNSLPLSTSQNYLDLFPSKQRLRALKNIPTVFVDSSPWYLNSPSVAPRVKQDPVARTVSSHNMEIEAQKSSKKCWGRGTNRVCRREMLPLLQEFRSQRDLDFDWPEDLSGCNFNETVNNPKDKKTWGQCWRCDQYVYGCSELSRDEMTALGGCRNSLYPRTAMVPLTQYGLYAAQIAWWLSFFPPETFLILTREELQDRDRVLLALNKVLEHVGYPDVSQFTHRIIGDVKGFNGKYKGDMSADDQQALKEIADYFEQPNKDLQTLMDTYFPDAGFKGFAPEYTEHNLNPYKSEATTREEKLARMRNRFGNFLDNIKIEGKTAENSIKDDTPAKEDHSPEQSSSSEDEEPGTPDAPSPPEDSSASSESSTDGKDEDDEEEDDQNDPENEEEEE